jgi:hypothetical protein
MPRRRSAVDAAWAGPRRVRDQPPFTARGTEDGSVGPIEVAARPPDSSPATADASLQPSPNRAESVAERRSSFWGYVAAIALLFLAGGILSTEEIRDLVADGGRASYRTILLSPVRGGK